MVNQLVGPLIRDTQNVANIPQRKAFVGEVSSETFCIGLHFMFESCCGLPCCSEAGSAFSHLYGPDFLNLYVHIKTICGNIEGNGYERSGHCFSLTETSGLG